MAKGTRGGRQRGISNSTIIPDNMPEEFSDVLGPKGESNALLSDLAQGKLINDGESSQYTNYYYSEELRNLINPNFDKDKQYRVNCQRCVCAVEAQFRGYNVEALGNNNDWQGIDTLLRFPVPVRFTKNQPDDVAQYNADDYLIGTSNYSGINSTLYNIVKNPNMSDGISIPEKTKRGASAVAKQLQDKMNSWGPNSRGVLCVKWKDTESSHTVNVVNTPSGMTIIDGQTGKVIRGEERIVKYLSRTTANHTAMVRTDNKQINNSQAGSSWFGSQVRERMSISKIFKQKPRTQADRIDAWQKRLAGIY